MTLTLKETLLALADSLDAHPLAEPFDDGDFEAVEYHLASGDHPAAVHAARVLKIAERMRDSELFELYAYPPFDSAAAAGYAAQIAAWARRAAAGEPPEFLALVNRLTELAGKRGENSTWTDEALEEELGAVRQRIYDLARAKGVF